jgi:hypothetical protein
MVVKAVWGAAKGTVKILWKTAAFVPRATVGTAKAVRVTPGVAAKWTSNALGAGGFYNPYVFAGAFGLGAIGMGVLGSGYRMDSPRTAWGRTPGMAAPYGRSTMSFRTVPTSFDMGAIGSLAFALHNQRKG